MKKFRCPNPLNSLLADRGSMVYKHENLWTRTLGRLLLSKPDEAITFAILSEIPERRISLC